MKTASFLKKQIKIKNMATINVNAFEKGLVIKNGELINVLNKGSHYFGIFNDAKVTIVKMNSILIPIIPKEVMRMNKSFVKETEEITVSDSELALVFDGKKLKTVLKKGDYFIWKDANFTYKLLDVNSIYVTDEEILKLSKSPELESDIRQFIVTQNEVGLLYLNGKLEKVLDPGLHTFWKNNHTIELQLLDLRKLPLEILGQEILTKDKIALRINFSLTYQLIDPMKVASIYKDIERQLYIQAQLVLREFVGSITLDDLLEKRKEISSEVQQELSDLFDKMGVELINSGIKDIILPGDIREILNQVLVAEKKAQANVIMRREETASTRSLLNTAKLMEENAMLTKLKELEYVERIAEKFNELNINGNGNMLQQLKTIVS